MKYLEYISKLKEKFLKSFEEKDFLKAIFAGERILKLYEENKEIDTLAYAEDIFNLACVYFDVGKFDRTLELYTKSLNITEKLKGTNTRFADILNNIAVTYSKMGDYNTALEYYKKTFNIRRSILNETHYDYISTLYNIGNAYYDVENYDKAIYYHLEVIKINKTQDLDSADCLNCIAYCFEAKENYERAIKYCKDGLNIIKSIEGIRSEEYLKNIYYLGALYEKAQDYESSAMCYEKASTLMKTFITEKHPYYAEAINKLAAVYTKLNNNKKALSLRFKALNIIKEIVGVNHIYYANSLKSVADIFYDENDFKRAKELYIEEIDIKKRLLGSDNDEYLKDSITLSDIYINLNEYNNADILLNNIIKEISKENKLYIECIMLLAKIYINNGEDEKLQDIYKKLMEIDNNISFDDMIKEVRS